MDKNFYPSKEYALLLQREYYVNSATPNNYFNAAFTFSTPLALSFDDLRIYDRVFIKFFAQLWLSTTATAGAIEQFSTPCRLMNQTTNLTIGDYTYQPNAFIPSYFLEYNPNVIIKPFQLTMISDSYAQKTALLVPTAATFHWTFTAKAIGIKNEGNVFEIINAFDNDL